MRVVAPILGHGAHRIVVSIAGQEAQLAWQRMALPVISALHFQKAAARRTQSSVAVTPQASPLEPDSVPGAARDLGLLIPGGHPHNICRVSLKTAHMCPCSCAHMCFCSCANMSLTALHLLHVPWLLRPPAYEVLRCRDCCPQAVR